MTRSPAVKVVKMVVKERNANEVTTERKKHPNYKIIQTMLYYKGIAFEKLHTSKRTIRKLPT